MLENKVSPPVSEADAVVTWLRAAARCHMIRQYANRFVGDF